MRENKVILVDTGSESNHLMMSDVEQLKYVKQITKLYNFKSKFLDLLFRIHFGFKLNKKIDIPFKSIWDNMCVLDNMINEEDEYYVILVNDVIRRLSPKKIRCLLKKSNVKLFILLLDSYDKIQPYFRRCIEKIPKEMIYSFQKSDCQKYGFDYTDTIYSKIELNDLEGEEAEDIDVYFVGADKGRIDELYDIYIMLTKKNMKCKFVVVVSKQKLKKYEKKYSGIEFLSNRISYKNILKQISKAKCILEVCQEGQDGLTMRFYEALFYNKFLITNNKTVINHERYDERFMKYYSDVEQLKCLQLDYSQTIDYGYNGEYSPKFFVEKILKKQY